MGRQILQYKDAIATRMQNHFISNFLMFYLDTLHEKFRLDFILNPLP